MRTLSRCALLRDFTDTGLQILASIAEARTIPPGTALFVEGAAGDAMHVVAAGKVRVSIRGPDGADVALAALGEGESLGELSLVAPGTPRRVSASAEGEVQLVTLRQSEFARLQTSKPQACAKLALAIAAALGRRLAESGELLGALLSTAARK